MNPVWSAWALVLTGTLSACYVGGHAGGRVLVAPESRVVVDVGPPPPQVEVVAASPGAEWVWVSGYWHWDGHAWIWIAGQWVWVDPGYVWVAPRYERSVHGVVYVHGYYWHPHRHVRVYHHRHFRRHH